MELMSRPGLLGIEVATWGWRRDLAWSSKRSRPGKEVGTWPRLLGHLVSRPEHCSGHCSWALFTLKKKEYKSFKNFLVYDLIYKIFILHFFINKLTWYVKYIFFFRCVNSVSGMYLHPLRYVINVVCF